MDILLRKIGNQLGDTLPCNRMYPFRYQITQRPQDERAQVRPGMRKNGIGSGAHEAVQIDYIEVERAWSVHDAARSSFRYLDFL